LSIKSSSESAGPEKGSFLAERKSWCTSFSSPRCRNRS
jgi:hypothetical protein